MRVATSAILLLLLVPLAAERIHPSLLADSYLETETPDDALCTFDDTYMEGEDDAVETLSTTTDAEKQQNPEAVKPFQQPEASMSYEEVGCFDLEEHDEGNGGAEAPDRDTYCRDFKPQGDGIKCRSGLPFYRKALQRQDGSAEFAECMGFCLTVGLDIFGLVDPNKAGVEVETVECRCGASKHNLQAWNGLNYKDYLIAELWDAVPKKAESEACPVRIGKYDEQWMEKFGNGGTPVSLLRVNVFDNDYMHQIFHATTDSVAVEDGKTGDELGGSTSPEEQSYLETSSHHVLSADSNASALVIRRGAMYSRDCANVQCASGKAWGNRIYYAFTNDMDSVRLTAYSTAIQRVAANIPCIEFLLLKCKDNKGKERPGGRCLESDLTSTRYGRGQAPAEGVILVGNREPHDPHSGCYTAGLGFPGRYSMRFINLGWCNSNKHVGTMMHETGHALGMNHEHNRADAGKEYMGEGPYLEINVEAIKETAMRRAKQNYPKITQRELDDEVTSALYQYEADDTTYIGSAARGGRTPFDYGSIMMYPASDQMRSNRRRSSQAALPGCVDEHCLDSMMGQRNDFSEEDTLQLRDMYGCLPRQQSRCPAIYGSEPVDTDGDCQCPAGTICYHKGTKGCPYARQAAKLNNHYFSHDCEDCRCVAPSCPASAKAMIAPPDKEGDCKCPPSTVCRQGSGYCRSSRSNNDAVFFSDTCEGCVCRPMCHERSNAVADFADDDGDCLCPLETLCVKGASNEPGCPKSRSRYPSTRHFLASCTDCACKEKPPPPATCKRPEGEGAVTASPDSMGDCLCKKGTVCVRGDNFVCDYSGGISTQFYSAECMDCKCAAPANSAQAKQLQRPLFLPAEMCVNAQVPTKCGAIHAQVGKHVWDLGGLGLKAFECGRCILALQASRQRGTCERGLDGVRLHSHYGLVDSASDVDFCCRVFTCDQHRTYNKLNPCEGYICGGNAHCGVVEDVLSRVKKAKCFCHKGFEPAHNGLDCVPEVPPGSRCCTYMGYYMWVPHKYLQRSKFLGCSPTDKLICPNILGQQWSHGGARCNMLSKNARFVYKGDLQTPAV